MSELEALVLHDEVGHGLWAQHKIGPFTEPPFAGFRAVQLMSFRRRVPTSFDLFIICLIHLEVSQSTL